MYLSFIILYQAICWEGGFSSVPGNESAWFSWPVAGEEACKFFYTVGFSFSFSLYLFGIIFWLDAFRPCIHARLEV